MEDNHADIYEKIGHLSGGLGGLKDQVSGLDKKLDILIGKIDENTKLTHQMRSVVTLVSGGISTVIAVVITAVVSVFTGGKGGGST